MTMAVLIAFLSLFVIVGIFKPYLKNSKRWHFVVALLILVVLAGVMAPEPSGKAVLGQDRDEAEALADKASEFLKNRTGYLPEDYPKMRKSLGADLFKKANTLEAGAAYSAAESKFCDKVLQATVSEASSRSKGLTWFVDCKNGDRFMVNEGQAREALERSKENKLSENDVPASCSMNNLAMCSATKAQKSADKGEITAVCSEAVKQVLIGDSSFSWGSKMVFGEGDIVQVQQEFKASNALGATLNNTYYCDFDAEKMRIKKLFIRGPLGDKTII
jgi:hypothetical protein